MAIVDLLSQRTLHRMSDAEPSRFDELEAAGFKLDRYGSIIHHLYNRMGGHYMDVGTSAKISKGLIKNQTSAPVSYTEKGLLLDDGTELDADVIVFTTGFEGNMKYLVKDIFGEEIAEQMGDFWGLDEEGEVKGAWKANREFPLFRNGKRVIRGMNTNGSRSSDVVSWRYARVGEVLFSIYCPPDQGENVGDSVGGLLQDTVRVGDQR
jgi:hypothetical protein